HLPEGPGEGTAAPLRFGEGRGGGSGALAGRRTHRSAPDQPHDPTVVVVSEEPPAGQLDGRGGRPRHLDPVGIVGRYRVALARENAKRASPGVGPGEL